MAKSDVKFLNQSKRQPIFPELKFINLERRFLPPPSSPPSAKFTLSQKIKPNSFSFAAQGGDQKCYSKDEQPDH